MSEIGSGTNSSYPGALDTNSIPEVNSPAAGKTKARKEVVEDLTHAVIMIETELGTDPAGSLTDVKTFLQTHHQTDGTHKTTHGPHKWLDEQDYSNFTAAVAAAANKTLVVARSINLDANTVIGATVSLMPLNPGLINANGFTLTINGSIVGNPMHQWLSGFAAGEVTGLKQAYAEWFDVNDFNLALAIVGSTCEMVVHSSVKLTANLSTSNSITVLNGTMITKPVSTQYTAAFSGPFYSNKTLASTFSPDLATGYTGTEAIPPLLGAYTGPVTLSNGGIISIFKDHILLNTKVTLSGASTDPYDGDPDAVGMYVPTGGNTLAFFSHGLEQIRFSKAGGTGFGVVSIGNGDQFREQSTTGDLIIGNNRQIRFNNSVPPGYGTAPSDANFLGIGVDLNNIVRIGGGSNTGGSAGNLNRIKIYPQQTLAVDAAIAIIENSGASYTTTGMLFITETAYNTSAIFMLQGYNQNSISEVLDSGGYFSHTQNNAATINLYYSSGWFYVQNKLSYSATVYITVVGCGVG